MNIGKPLFAQLMDFLPWSTFARIVAALRWRRPGADAVLCRAIPRDGVRAIDLSREPARYRSLPVGSCPETLSHGFSRAGPTIDVWRTRTRRATGAFTRISLIADRPSEEALCRRKPGYGAGQHGLCSGFHDHRSVPVAVSMGALSLHQGRGEDAHAARSARQYPELHSHLRRQDARRSRSRSADSPKRAPSTSWIAAISTSRAFTSCIRLAPSSSPAAKSNLDAHRVYSAPTDRATGIIADQTIALDGFSTRKDYPSSSAPSPVSRMPNPVKGSFF